MCAAEPAAERDLGVNSKSSSELAKLDAEIDVDAVCTGVDKSKFATDWSAIRSERLEMDATAAISKIRKSHCDGLSRHGAMRSAFLHEYWTLPGKSVVKADGDTFVPDIGTKSMSVHRFEALLSMSQNILERT